MQTIHFVVLCFGSSIGERVKYVAWTQVRPGFEGSSASCVAMNKQMSLSEPMFICKMGSSFGLWASSKIMLVKILTVPAVIIEWPALR